MKESVSHADEYPIFHPAEQKYKAKPWGDIGIRPVKQAQQSLHPVHPSAASLSAGERSQSGPRFTNMYAVIGTDFAGKSLAMTNLSQRLEGRFISYDEDFLEEDCDYVSRLKREFLARFPSYVQGRCSMELLLGLLQPIVMYLRECVLNARTAPHILVNGYYYKLLAKCRLFGIDNPPIFSLWRQAPQPSAIIFLDTDPETTWARSKEGHLLNPFEYYGPTPCRDAFLAFQRDLKDVLLEEVDGIPIHYVRGDSDPVTVLNCIEQFIKKRQFHEN